MVDEVSGKIVAYLRKGGNFRGFIEERIQLVFERICNKSEYDMKDLRKMAGQLEEFSDSKVVQSVLNVRDFKYNFWVGRFC